MSSSKPITTNVKPQMRIKSTLYKTKKFLNKSLTHLQSFIPTNTHQNQPKTPTFSKLQELDDFYTSLSENCGANSAEEVMKKKACNLSQSVERKRDEHQCSKRSITNWGCRGGLKDLKEVRKQEETSPVAAYVLAQKMKDLEMMDLDDMDHAMDVEEVLHYYSRLNCPAYVEIVDNFFMDMYSEFQPSGSLNNSMRKLGSQSLNTSMRTLAPLKL